MTDATIFPLRSTDSIFAFVLRDGVLHNVSVGALAAYFATQQTAQPTPLTNIASGALIESTVQATQTAILTQTSSTAIPPSTSLHPPTNPPAPKPPTPPTPHPEVWSTLEPVPNPSGLAFKFGSRGAMQDVTMAEMLYARLPVGFGNITQTRWRSNPITVNGIQFILMPAVDSDGRFECAVLGAFSLTNNRENADVDFQILQDGIPIPLFSNNDLVYSYNHQRSTMMRYQSKPMFWDTSYDFIASLVKNGAILPHGDEQIFGSSISYETKTDTHPFYLPFKQFTTTSNYPQTTYVGDEYRGASTGGERKTIGFVHQDFANIINEVWAKKNSAYVTPEILLTVQYLAESVAQFPHAALISGANERLIDPSAVPYSTHRNRAAWAPCIGIPQAGQDQNDPIHDGWYDNAHPTNKCSFYAYQLSKDPWHLLNVQAIAIASLAFCNGASRGIDGRISRVTEQEERGMWWGLQTLVHAWYCTPDFEMPAPFKSKSFWENAINNTLHYLRNKFINKTASPYTNQIKAAMDFWRSTDTFELGYMPNEIMVSPFMHDYGHGVRAQMLLLGYTSARDVVEWFAVNAQRRYEMGGNWYLSDPAIAAKGGLAQSVVWDKAAYNLPYSTIEEYKAKHPRASLYVNANLQSTDWTIDYGRDTYLFTGILVLYGELVDRKLITLNFDPKAAVVEFRARHLPPYISVNGLPLNYTSMTKQQFQSTFDI